MSEITRAEADELQQDRMNAQLWAMRQIMLDGNMVTTIIEPDGQRIVVPTHTLVPPEQRQEDQHGA